MNRIMPLYVIFTTFICIAGSPSLKATSTGITLRTLNTSFGCGPAGCHSVSANAQTQLSILEAVNDEVSVAAGASIVLTLRVAHAQRPAAGVNISVKSKLQGGVDAGTLERIDGQGLHLQGPELTHSTPKLLSGGSVEFKFRWKAPLQEGTYYLHAIANAVNLNGNRDQNDIWNWLTPVAVNVSPVSSVHDYISGATGLRISPVPAHESVVVSAKTTPGELLHISIFDVSGNVVKQFTNVASTNVYQVEWDGMSNAGGRVSPGTYYVKVQGEKNVTSGTILWM